MKKFKHMITYIGNGTYTDTEGKEWKNRDSFGYDADVDADAFLEERKDLKFMVEYEAMIINSVSASIATTEEQSEIKEDAPKTATNAPKSTAPSTAKAK